jgi:hypothetical protein
MVESFTGPVRKLGGRLRFRVALTLSFWLSVCSAAHGMQSVTLAWNSVSSPAVTGYYLYYGVRSGVYTNRVDCGMATTNTVAGLVEGVKYYFAVTSHDANGDESPYSTEYVFIAPGLVKIAPNAGRSIMDVSFPVAAPHSYEVQVSEDLRSWTSLWVTQNQETNQWLQFDDAVTNSVARRFYRVLQH